MPVTANTQVQLFWENRKIASAFQAGVSLHSHTMYSEESLDLIPSYIVDACYRAGCLPPGPPVVCPPGGYNSATRFGRLR
jgi:hypothetical protein